ncbi:MAG: sigma-54-dependent Fis family transcriptional regulator [Betaproteobacteria bacterium]|nr:sigma-54-dependent Fis family transcriptional regulator [Betaproteobacteria bacterium]MDE2623049.1 sigma-54-dependent Fis family transcriptional regulator [Betaproteobacteria bacterium]
MANHILVVDDEVGIRELLSEILSDEGYRVKLAANALEAKRLRQEERPDLVLLDIWMPQMDGITLLKEWGAVGQLTMPVVMMSGHATVDTAVEATRIGAFDFLEKPIALPKLLATVERALRKGGAEFRPGLSSSQLGKGPLISELRRRLDQIISHNAPVLLVGEPGCGIELAARHLHQPNTPWFSSSDNEWLAENPFEPLAETQGGVIFIPEICELTRSQQRGLSQLLGKLEKHHVRLICASSKPVAVLIRDDVLDTTLVSGLSALTLTIPALREHAEDIPEIATTLLRQMTEAGEVPVRALSTAALNMLRQMDWPGNLPMLTNAVRTAALSALTSEITAEDVARLAHQFDPPEPPAAKVASFDLPLREAREQFEKSYFEYHIRLESGNMSRVAERVGLERTHLYRKLKQLGIRLGSQRGEE